MSITRDYWRLQPDQLWAHRADVLDDLLQFARRTIDADYIDL